MSRDDSLSAGDLRARMLAGGSLPDDALSAAQVRARHGLAYYTRRIILVSWVGGAFGACLICDGFSFLRCGYFWVIF